MRAEAVLRQEGFPFRLVPAPRQLSAECGTALSFDPQELGAEQIEAALRAAQVPFAAIHVLAGQDRRQKGGGNGSE